MKVIDGSVQKLLFRVREGMVAKPNGLVRLNQTQLNNTGFFDRGLGDLILAAVERVKFGGWSFRPNECAASDTKGSL